ncbi:signal peptidase I [Paenibacillus darwinianus]|uniref:Signal peptidase I n=2 Tax=Paenibacillus darwinianus TaxID=1380763 RepID=A0A9W5RZQ3_9BACL|nr:signal peptidase I [Paenibacillus darwinianus]EXX86231.1 signal peptidase I [Paenibacillus darwinianus]EXX86622.1 signal peptidase I [Paenibacillus darwinianus]
MDQSQSNQSDREPANQEARSSAERVQAGEMSASEARRGDGNGGGNKFYKEIVEWIKALAIAGILVFVIRWFLFAPFIVDGPSMQPNFETGERLIVNKILYDIRAPKRGEVVVFYVAEEKRDFIKRVIGVPGDKIRLEGDDLYINGVRMEEPYIKEAIANARKQGQLYNQRGENFPNGFVTEDTVPEGMILAFGDNRSNSKDSRIIGFMPYDRIIGRADVIFWPMDKISLVKHPATVPADEK